MKVEEYNSKREQLQNLLSQETRTKEEKKMIHTLSLELQKIKAERKSEWKKNEELRLSELKKESK